MAGWRFAQSGGIFFETLIHTLLWQRWLLDRPEVLRVFAWGQRTFFEDYAYPDVVWAQVEYAGGLSAMLGENHLTDQGFGSRVVVGTEDSLYFEGLGRLLLGGKSRPPEVVLDVEETFQDCLRSSLAHFVECVRSGRQPEITGEDGRAATELALAANRSMASGQPVELPLTVVAR
jgi:predicted dehydrogenase